MSIDLVSSSCTNSFSVHSQHITDPDYVTTTIVFFATKRTDTHCMEKTGIKKAGIILVPNSLLSLCSISAIGDHFTQMFAQSISLNIQYAYYCKSIVLNNISQIIC